MSQIFIAILHSSIAYDSEESLILTHIVMLSNFLYCDLLLLYSSIIIQKDLVIKIVISQVVLCTNVHFARIGESSRKRDSNIVMS